MQQAITILALFIQDKGEYDEALEFYHKALSIWLEVLGEKHPYVATSYHFIGIIHKDKGDYGKALEFYQKALAMRLEVHGEKHPDVAESYNHIGTVYDKQNDMQKALSFFQKSIMSLVPAFSDSRGGPDPLDK